MQPFDWLGFLQQWNQDFLRLDSVKEELPPEVVASGWLGYPGATEEQIVQAEDRLGVRLSPSYRAFLSVSNGWRLAPLWIEKLWSTEEIEWFAVFHQEWIDVWQDEGFDLPPISDNEYLVYGDAQRSYNLRLDYMQTALQISPNWPDENAVYLLNPQIVTHEGEWEAWYLSNDTVGARRYRSFEEMMRRIYTSVLVNSMRFHR